MYESYIIYLVRIHNIHEYKTKLSLLKKSLKVVNSKIFINFKFCRDLLTTYIIDIILKNLQRLKTFIIKL